MPKAVWLLSLALFSAMELAEANHESGPYQEVHGIENLLIPIPKPARGKTVGTLETCGKYFVRDLSDGTVSFTARVLFRDKVRGGESMQDFLLYGKPERLVLSLEEKETPTAEFFFGENGRRRIILRISRSDYLSSPCLSQITRV